MNSNQECQCQCQNQNSINDATMYSYPTLDTVQANPTSQTRPQQPMQQPLQNVEYQRVAPAQNVYMVQPKVVNEEQKVCGYPVPLVDQTTAVVLLVLNLVLFPGIGTMFLGCLGRNEPKSRWFWIGLAQMLTAMCCIGWIWSILTSVKVIQKANANVNPYNRSAVIGRPVVANNNF